MEQVNYPPLKEVGFLAQIFMNKEDKQLLLTDICARLPYGVKCQFEDTIRIRDGESDPFYDKVLSPRALDLFINHTNFYIKAYLRPMSSMTEEEKKEYYTFQYKFTLQAHEYQELNNETFLEYVNWLNAHHFDFRHLIEKGLALEAPEGMYDNKEEQQ